MDLGYRTVLVEPDPARLAGRPKAHGDATVASIGDADPDVQKSLSWAYRSMAVVDLPATTAALERQASIAAREGDGNRSWVVRDSLAKLETGDASRIREAIRAVRRRPNAPSTSEAAALAARFGDMGLGRRMPEPPLT